MQCAAQEHAAVTATETTQSPHPHFFHLLHCQFLFVAPAFFQGSPFQGIPFSGQPFFRDSRCSLSSIHILPFVPRVPELPPILLEGFSPGFSAHIAPDAPGGVIQVSPPKPSMAVRCGALQVLPVGLDFLHCIAGRPCQGHVQHIHFNSIHGFC